MPAIGAFIGAIASTIGGAIATLGPIGSLVLRLVVSVAASALLQALAPKPREPGIKTQVTQTGGKNPCSFLLGTYATGGQRACPPMSHGTDGKTPNAYGTEVIELSDIPGVGLHRLIINEEYVTLGLVEHPDYGFPVTGRYAGYAWLKFYNGNQTTADPGLLAKYGTYPERPWSADMIGRGVCYAIFTFRYNRSLWGGAIPPRLRFELGGIPMYDPRKDTTVGGSGTHRWANKATWASSTNPMVMIYNILRGIALDDGSVWGGGFAAADLPLASWFAAMNECDVLVNNGAGGTEAQFRAGIEVSVDEEPSDVIAELLKTCAGQVAEIGGIWKTRVGPPGLPVMSITDGDIIVTEDQDYAPFPGFTSSYNGVHATYPEPAMLWEPKEAPPLYNAVYEAQDQGQRLIADLNLVACPYGAQVRRLEAAYIAEERRHRRHGQTLPPDCAVLEPLDAIAWTSTANAYASKVFEVSEVAEDLHTCLQQVALRERDPADFVSTNPAPPPVVSTAIVIFAAQTVPNFAVSGTSIPDAAGADRRPALSLTWEPDLDDVTGILWEVRLQATGVIVARGSTQNVAAGALLVTDGIIASTAYEVRAQPVVDRAATWTLWIPATTPATLISRLDIGVGAVTDKFVTAVLGPLQAGDTPTGTVLLTYSHGPVNPGEIWRRSLIFEARNTLATDLAGYVAKVELLSRRKPHGLPYGPWDSLAIMTTKYLSDYGTNVWVPYADSGQFSSNLEDIQYQVIVNFRPPLLDPTFAWIKNIYFTTAEVTR